MTSMKRLLKRLMIGFPPARKLIQALAGDFPRVFVYHRFSPAGIQLPHRVSGDIFGRQLEEMMKFGRLLTLAECVEEYREKGRWPRQAVIVTVDDGYHDFYQYAFPELKKRRLPATLFPAVNFIEGLLWLWPDRLMAALEARAEGRLTVTAHGGELELVWDDSLQRFSVWKWLSDLCISLPDDLRQALISEVEERLDVLLPATPLAAYAPCRWDQLIEMADTGIEIGSHSMNHPILSRIPLHQLDMEIAGSKAVLEQRLARPVKTFCYPNSGPGDINDAVVAAVQRAGYLGAVFGTDLQSWDPWRVPRMGISGDWTEFRWKLAGGESFHL